MLHVIIITAVVSVLNTIIIIRYMIHFLKPFLREQFSTSGVYYNGYSHHLYKVLTRVPLLGGGHHQH